MKPPKLKPRGHWGGGCDVIDAEKKKKAASGSGCEGLNCVGPLFPSFQDASARCSRLFESSSDGWLNNKDEEDGEDEEEEEKKP